NLNSFDETINSSNVEFSGSITDKFVEWGPLVEDIYGINYDVNDYLFVPYELTNNTTETKTETELATLNQDGTFTIRLKDLTPGDYTLVINAKDKGESSNVVEEIDFTVE